MPIYDSGERSAHNEVRLQKRSPVLCLADASCRLKSTLEALTCLFLAGPSNEAPPGPAMCGYYLLELLGYLPDPSRQGHIAGWFIVFSQRRFFSESTASPAGSACLLLATPACSVG